MSLKAAIAQLTTWAENAENNVQVDEIEGSITEQTQSNREDAVSYRKAIAILEAHE